MRLVDVEAYDGDKFTAVWHSDRRAALAHGMSLDESRHRTQFSSRVARLVEPELRDGLFSAGFAV